MSQQNVLVLTVGTGNAENIKETLLNPLGMSIKKGKWNRVILLPSTVTEDLAEQLTEWLRNPPPIQTKPLPQPGMENNADACFGHFDAVLGDLIKEKYERKNIVIDFTRGTKAMSAALALAAVRWDIPLLRYIHGERGPGGMVIPGTEKILEFRTVLVTARKKLDTAVELMDKGNFAAVLELIPEAADQLAKTFPEEFYEEATRLRRRAYFYAAWDRLYYKEASRRAENLQMAHDNDLENQIDWVCELAKEPPMINHMINHESMARWLQIVSCDLLHNGWRRIDHRHFEDALLRAYRVLELIGQFLLFKRGIDSESIDPEIQAVKRLQKKLEKKGSYGFTQNKKTGRLKAAKDTAARLLRELDEPLAEKLIHFDDKHPTVQARQRNSSILIHGFAAVSDPDALREIYVHLKSLLEESCPEEILVQSQVACAPFSKH